jgi:hypothetical protein
MVESRDELIMEFTDKYGYNHIDEDADDEDEDEDDDDKGNAAATPAAAMPPPAPTPPAATTDVITIIEEDSMEMVPEQDALRPMKLSWQMQSLSCRSPASST